MLAKIQISKFITIAELRKLKSDLLIKKIKLYKMYCNLDDDIIKLHLSESNEDLLKLIFESNTKIINFKLYNK